MCKYCETNTWDKCMQVWMGKPICNTKYESCKIVHENDDYCFYLSGTYEDWSDPISYCPFCGKELKKL